MKFNPYSWSDSSSPKGGGRGEEWHWVILRSWNHPDFLMNPKLFTGSREGVLGKPFLGRGGG